MKNLKTPHAIILGFGLVALSIASLPYANKTIKPAFANRSVYKIAICDSSGYSCVDVRNNMLLVKDK